MSETMKFLIDQAIKYPAIRQRLENASSAKEIKNILADSSILIPCSQLEPVVAYLKEKLAQ